MLRLSKLTDYGMVLMTVLASAPEQTRNAADIAAQTHIGAPTVRKLLKRLARQGLVDSTRGVHGGYRLAHAPADISVAQVINALEGPIGLTECTLHDGRCGIENDCRLRGNWHLITNAVRDALAGVTLADMAHPLGGFRLHAVTGGAAAGTAHAIRIER